MEFEQLVRKYLRGALSPAEMESLRRLLESVPAFRTELRQILDLRSVINDDALRLNPPADLAERTRALVGARFAGIEALLRDDAGALVPPRELADSTRDAVARMFAETASRKVFPLPIDAAAPVQSGSEKTPRRAVAVPWRYAFSGLAAAVIATFVAVGPSLRQAIENPYGTLPNTLRQSTEVRAPRGTTGGEARRAPAPTVRLADPAEPAAAADRTPNLPDASGAPRSSSGAVASTMPSATLAASASTAEDAATEPVTTSDAAAAAPRNDALASQPAPEQPREPSSARPSEEFRSPQPSDLRDSRPDLAARPSDTPVREVAAIATVPEPFAFGGDASNRPRLMALGVTLGSGGVAEENTPTPLMQNSYYLSFNVSPNDRIGVEMGGSTFMQERQRAEAQRGPGGFGKGSSSEDSIGTARPGQQPVSYTIISQRSAQQITYGGIFYDRRLRIDRSWDVCSRVTVGATDGALVGGLRAYAAFSPSPNLTLTAGVGGSTLFNLTRRTDRASINYGIYYGIETGF